MDDSTRSTLLVRLRDRGDTVAWETFHSLYRPLICGYAVSRGLGAAEAEDVAQQCSQVVLERIAEYEHLGSFKAWLRAIAEHKIVDQVRRARRVVQGDTAFWGEQRAAVGAPEPDSPEAMWDRQWERAHIMHCAERAKKSVNESTYEAFEACVVRGMEPAAVAALLNLTVSQVYVAKHRVLERIRALLRDLHGQDGVL